MPGTLSPSTTTTSAGETRGRTSTSTSCAARTPAVAHALRALDSLAAGPSDLDGETATVDEGPIVAMRAAEPGPTAGGGARRPLSGAGRPRRGRLRRGLPRRADGAGAARGGAEGDQARLRHAPGARALRGRATGRSPSWTIRASRRSTTRARRRRADPTSSWSSCAAVRSRSTATSAGSIEERGWSSSCASAKPCSTPTTRRSCTATSSRRT